MHRKRNHNIALILIGAGLFLLADNHLSFFTVVALFLLLIGVHKFHSGDERKGYADDHRAAASGRRQFAHDCGDYSDFARLFFTIKCVKCIRMAVTFASKA